MVEGLFTRHRPTWSILSMDRVGKRKREKEGEVRYSSTALLPQLKD